MNTRATIEAALPALKRAAAIAQAEYRHAWDYESRELEVRAYEKTVSAHSRLEMYELLLQRIEIERFDIALHPANKERLLSLISSRLREDHSLAFPPRKRE